MKRVCRAALQCEAYSLRHVTEHGDRLRASVLEILGKLLVRGEWEEVARQSMLHVQYSGCRSLTDHLLPSIPKQIEDKRLSIELGGLGQTQRFGRMTSLATRRSRPMAIFSGG